MGVILKKNSFIEANGKLEEKFKKMTGLGFKMEA